jgi:hypothetical protein
MEKTDWAAYWATFFAHPVTLPEIRKKFVLKPGPSATAPQMALFSRCRPLSIPSLINKSGIKTRQILATKKKTTKEEKKEEK